LYFQVNAFIFYYYFYIYELSEIVIMLGYINVLHHTDIDSVCFKQFLVDVLEAKDLIIMIFIICRTVIISCCIFTSIIVKIMIAFQLFFIIKAVVVVPDEGGMLRYMFFTFYFFNLIIFRYILDGKAHHYHLSLIIPEYHDKTLSYLFLTCVNFLSKKIPYN